MVMRGLDTAIIDEADSVLIDEAVTPLIISRQEDNSTMDAASRNAHKLAMALVPGKDYKKDIRYREIRITGDGYEKISRLSESLSGFWQGLSRRQELVHQALNAIEFYHRDEQYVVSDEKIIIVDEFTGRLMPNRTWRQGLHQAVEIKEGLETTNPSETLARISFQRFFRFFRNLSGMTGTAKEAASEFWHIYGLPYICIPTNRECIRKTISDSVHPDSEQKWTAIVNSIKKINDTGRPVLVGTRSVAASEKIAAMLEEKNLTFNLLNAVKHKEEARIIASAGDKGMITIATNMAGRGTDIKLGQGIAEKGGLHVIATERHESERIDRQLFGRCARQGDPGSCQAFISPDDELIQRFFPGYIKKPLSITLHGNLPGMNRFARGSVFLAQQISQRQAFKQRRNVLRMDSWLEESLSFTKEQF